MWCCSLCLLSVQLHSLEALELQSVLLLWRFDSPLCKWRCNLKYDHSFDQREPHTTWLGCWWKFCSLPEQFEEVHWVLDCEKLKINIKRCDARQLNNMNNICLALLSDQVFTEWEVEVRAGMGRRRRKYGDASLVYVVAQFYAWFNFNYLLFFVLGYGNVW